MGGAISQLIPCLNPDHHHHHHPRAAKQPHAPSNDVVFTAEQPLDETLGHSFCYVRSSARFLSPTSSDRFLSPGTHSLRFDDPNTRLPEPAPAFRAISGASVSANTATPRTVLDSDDPAACAASVVVNGFDCSASFAALPLQTVPRGGCNDGHFLSGPIERGAVSGPIDDPPSTAGRIPFSAPLTAADGGGNNRGYYKKRRKGGSGSLGGIKRRLYRSFSEKKRPWVVPVGRKDGGESGGGCGGEEVVRRESGMDGSNVEWAVGKAGEDRVHVVVSEEHGWLFVGIYDGFNGPDAPEFLMGHLYRAVFHELKGLFWDNEDECGGGGVVVVEDEGRGKVAGNEEGVEIVNEVEEEENRGGVVAKKVTFLEEDNEREVRRRKLWEFLAKDEAEDGLDLSGSDRFAFSVDDAVRASNVWSGVGLSKRSSLLLSRLKRGWGRSKDKVDVDIENRVDVEEVEGRVLCGNGRRRKTGHVDHELVLRALERALEKTENAYLDLTDRAMDRYPELALMGSCLLVALMRDEDVYVMNLGDSRAIVAQVQPEEGCSSVTESIVNDCATNDEKAPSVARECRSETMKLTALQLSTDHSTSIEEEVIRIKREHPDDKHCIVNDRVKGRLKVTRAFGVGFLKQAKFNDSLLEMFRNEFIGAAAYVSCIPSLRHHHLSPNDQFLVLSSDGLYQYLSNQEVVSFVENFLEKYPDGDPAQHLIEELLNRAAQKAGMDFHDLLDIPQGDRRKYHDDVTVMVISLEGRIWKSSGKYP